MVFAYEIKIPKSRIAVLIGKAGSTKKELEEKKEEARKGLREISEKRKNLRLEKTAMQKALDKIHDQSRDIARAIDGLDKMENNPSYKNNTP